MVEVTTSLAAVIFLSLEVMEGGGIELSAQGQD